MTPAVDPQAVAVRVREARTRLGLSQTALASQATVSRAIVSRIESAGRGVSLLEADRLAQVLQLPLDILLYGSQAGQRPQRTRQVLAAGRAADAARMSKRDLIALLAHHQADPGLRDDLAALAGETTDDLDSLS